MTTTTTGPLRTRPGGSPRRGRLAALVRGRPADPRWARPALLALLVLTAALYAAGLSRNGWANDFYAAAVQAGAKSWKAFFFGSFDAVEFHHGGQDARVAVGHGDLRQVVRPQFLEPAAATGGSRAWPASALLYATVRRWHGPAAGLIAGRRRGAHPGGRPDVPVRQPRRAAGAADDRGRVRHDPGDRVGAHPVAGADRRRCSGSRSSPRCCRGSWWSPRFALAYLVAGPPRLAGGCGSCSPAPRPWSSAAGLVGGDRGADPGGRPALHRRLHDEQRAAARPRLQRPRPIGSATRPARSASAAARARGSPGRPG